MAGGTYAEHMMLNFWLLGDTASRATSWSVGLSLGVPHEGTLSEVAAGSGYARTAVVFKSIAANTFVNSPAFKFGAFSSSANMSGAFVVDQNGSLLLYGTLATATAVAAGSSASFAASALTVVLS